MGNARKTCFLNVLEDARSIFLCRMLNWYIRVGLFSYFRQALFVFLEKSVRELLTAYFYSREVSVWACWPFISILKMSQIKLVGRLFLFSKSISLWACWPLVSILEKPQIVSLLTPYFYFRKVSICDLVNRLFYSRKVSVCELVDRLFLFSKILRLWACWLFIFILEKYESMLAYFNSRKVSDCELVACLFIFSKSLSVSLLTAYFYSQKCHSVSSSWPLISILKMSQTVSLLIGYLCSRKV